MGHFATIRVRLTLWYTLLLAIVLAAFSLGIYVALRRSLYEGLDTTLESRANALSQNVRVQAGTPRLTSSPVISSDDLGEQFDRLYLADGTIAFDNGVAPAAIAPSAAVIDDARRGMSTYRTVSTPGGRFRVLTVPVTRDGTVVAAVEVGQATDDVADTLGTLLLIVAVAAPLTLLVASLGGLFLARRALAPIDSLTRLTRRITARDLSQRLDVETSDDEIGRLTGTLNDMIARLDESFRRQRQFTADASHELRTPLTALKGQVEVALGRPRDAAAYRDVLEGVSEDIDRMIRLVGSLLTLARADAGQIPIAREAVRLESVVSDAVAALAPLAQEKGVDLRVTGGRPATVRGDEALLVQLLLNLLDNAIKYTPPGGHVTVGWESRAGHAVLAVEDTGIGIPEEDQARVFNRFYRVDHARGRAAGGAGLGLPIARWIADAHGATIAIESEPGRRTTVHITLPLATVLSDG